MPGIGESELRKPDFPTSHTDPHNRTLNRIINGIAYASGLNAWMNSFMERLPRLLSIFVPVYKMILYNDEQNNDINN